MLAINPAAAGAESCICQIELDNSSSRDATTRRSPRERQNMTAHAYIRGRRATTARITRRPYYKTITHGAARARSLELARADYTNEELSTLYTASVATSSRDSAEKGDVASPACRTYVPYFSCASRQTRSGVQSC